MKSLFEFLGSVNEAVGAFTFNYWFGNICLSRFDSAWYVRLSKKRRLNIHNIRPNIYEMWLDTNKMRPNVNKESDDTVLVTQA